ncbi:methionyl-tRNA formyltransferase [Rhodotorula paludigena]|uniref:methionyl-tRNA formyltransferase n=1 Tax=Rhodotorula paludigena TaxID=86838 RepID=UPI003174690F
MLRFPRANACRLESARLHSVRPPSKCRCLSSSRSLSSSSASSPAPPFRVLFFGADSFSCRVFERIHDARADLVDSLTVVTPPDQRTGRRLKEVHRPPLRILAEQLGVSAIPLPPTLLKGWQPPDTFLRPPDDSPSPRNLLLTASFGHLIPNSLLSHFLPLNALNVHPSLLPRWRGAAPIQWGIVSGDADGLNEGEGMGVTVQELSRGRFDRGRILAQQDVSVPPQADFPTLEPLLARASGDLLVSTLRSFASRTERAWTQDDTRATLAPKLSKADARADWSVRSADEVVRMQRGFGHQYPLWTTLDDSQIQLRISPIALPSPFSSPSPGSVAPDPSAPKRLLLQCREGCVELAEVKKEGGKWVGGTEWWNGVRRGRANLAFV